VSAAAPAAPIQGAPASRATAWIAARTHVCILFLALAGAARAQDFAPAAPAGPGAGAALLLERALPAAADRPALEGATVRWLGLPELETHAASLLVPVRSLRLAAGVSQTGEPAVGWTCVALAAGAAADGAGFALRAAARRDRATGALATSSLAAGAGAEAGAGGWLAPAEGWRLWAQAPQLWTTGESPPLVRPLELGARFEAGALAAWFAVGAPREGLDGERLAGIALARGALSAWAEGRDGPVRGAVGLAAVAGPLRVAARIEGHPVLGETSQLSVALCRGVPRGSP
jgi:hypothetical protein